MSEPRGFPAPRLPAELVAKILGLENSQSESYNTNEYPTTLQDGCSIALVCRDWVDYGRTILLRRQHIYVDHHRWNVGRTKGKLQNALDAIVQYPYLGAHVESLVFTVPAWSRDHEHGICFGEVEEGVDDDFPNDKNDVVEGRLQLFAASIGLLTSLKVLELDSIPCCHILAILSAVKSKQLRSLSWNRVNYWEEGVRGVPANSQALSQLRWELSTQRNLKHFHYSDCQIIYPLQPLINADAALPTSSLGQPLHLEDISLQTNDPTAKFFLQTTSTSSLTKVVLHLIPFRATCLLASE